MAFLHLQGDGWSAEWCSPKRSTQRRPERLLICYVEAVNHLPAASALSSGRVLKAIAAPGAPL